MQRPEKLCWLVLKRKELIWAWINGFLVIASVLTGVVIIGGLIWLIVTKGVI
jgi:hypothetical protein